MNQLEGPHVGICIMWRAFLKTAQNTRNSLTLLKSALKGSLQKNISLVPGIANQLKLGRPVFSKAIVCRCPSLKILAHAGHGATK